MVLNMYITMIPLLLSGILNMLFVKTSIYQKYKYPIDCYKTWTNGKRILGDNKTIIGFLSMIVLSSFLHILWGIFCNLFDLTSLNELYLFYENTLVYNLLIGFLFGFTYMLFELPNSMLKRLLDIKPGSVGVGLKSLFFFVDQVDSLLGVFFILLVFTQMSLSKYILYIFLGSLTHILVNVILYCLKVRKFV